MSSCNDVRTAGRFAHWDVVLGPNVDSKTSNPFTMGPWSWQLSVQRERAYAQTSVSLLSSEPEPPVSGMDRVASVSFQSLHQYRDSRSAGVTGPMPIEVLLDDSCSPGHILTMRNFVSASFVINFVDVRLEDEDGSSTSLWPLNNQINTVVQADAQSGFARMLNDGIFSDILVNADGGSIKAHRAVLASRSPVFMRMFSIDLKEKEQSIVDISDMSLEACQAFIGYMYGSISEKEFMSHCSELVSAADKYDIVELKNMCERSMVDDIDNDNVMERLQMAHLYGLSTLKKVCMWLLVEFLKIYDIPDGFREFMEKGDIDLVAEVVQSCIGQGNYHLRCWLQCNYLDWIHPVLKKEDHT